MVQYVPEQNGCDHYWYQSDKKMRAILADQESGRKSNASRNEDYSESHSNIDGCHNICCIHKAIQR